MAVVYKSYVDKFLNGFERSKEKALEEMGVVGTNNIKSETPVLSGELKEANDYQVQLDEVAFFNEKEYAPYVELGTFKQSANPFMRRGLNKSRQEFRAIVYDNLKV